MDRILSISSGRPPYELHNEHWTVSTAPTRDEAIGQGIVSVPLRKPHPPVVVTSVTQHSTGLTAAAARGGDLISSNYVQPHSVATNLPRYLDGLRQNGQLLNASGKRIAKSIFINEDGRKADAYAKTSDGPHGFYFPNIMRKVIDNGQPEAFRAWPDETDDRITLEQSLATQVIAGEVSSVVDQILAFRELVGEFGTLLYTGHDWIDLDLDRRSMELVARGGAAAGQRSSRQRRWRLRPSSPD